MLGTVGIIMTLLGKYHDLCGDLADETPGFTSTSFVRGCAATLLEN